MSNEHDDVDGTPEDTTSAAGAADATTSPAADAASGVGSQDVVDAAATAGTADDAVESDGADLDGADLDSADLDSADLDSADLDDADDADSEDENADGELVAVGAAAGSARAAARRSAVRSGVTEKKGRATLARDTDRGEKQANVLQRLGRFLREVVAELRKVIWPHRKQLITYTTVVLVFVVFMTALVFGLDALFARGVLAVFGGG